MPDNSVNLLADLKGAEVPEPVDQRLDAGDDPPAIQEDRRKDMEIVGKSFTDNEYFLPVPVWTGGTRMTCAPRWKLKNMACKGGCVNHEHGP